MGIVASIVSLTENDFETISNEKRRPTEKEIIRTTYLDKGWEIMSYILVGKLGPREAMILSEVIHPKESYIVYQDEYYTEFVNYSH